MADIEFFDNGAPLPVPAQTVFAVLKMIIGSRKGSDFYASLSDEDMVVVSSELINKVKSFIDENNVAPRAQLRANVLKCNEVTPPHRERE